MIRHVALFQFKEDAREDAAHFLEEGLFQLAQTISEISAYEYGPDLALREGNFDFAVVADFVDAAAFQSYAVHPDHQAFIQDRVAEVVADRVAIQFDL